MEGLLRDGLSASQIAYQFGVSRNAVIGIVHRDADLKAVGFVPKREKPTNVISLPRTNVCAFPNIRRVSPTSAPPKERPALRVVSNNSSMMVNDWLQKNGARTFKANERTDEFSVKQFLADRGYKVSGGWQGHSTITGNGVRRSKLRWSGVMAFVDELRVKEGLEPFKRKA